MISFNTASVYRHGQSLATRSQAEFDNDRPNHKIIENFTVINVYIAVCSPFKTRGLKLKSPIGRLVILHTIA